MRFQVHIYEKDIPNQKLIDDLKRVANKSGTNKLSSTQYLKTGKYSKKTYADRFGSWNKALEKADLIPGKVHFIKDEELLENIRQVWSSLGSQPKSLEMRAPISKFSIAPYLTAFSTWNHALEMFSLYNKDVKRYNELVAVRRKRRKRKRGTSIKIRFDVLKRDGYRCRACGRSPANHKGLELHVDHIKPVSQGGETKMSNLQTLCRECNVGKGIRS